VEGIRVAAKPHVTYDRGGDVLYVFFGKPVPAVAEGDPEIEGLYYMYDMNDRNKLVGYTVVWYSEYDKAILQAKMPGIDLPQEGHGSLGGQKFRSIKPLGRKAYGHIPHLPGSRMGPADHSCHEGQYRICCLKARDRHDEIVVQEKLDGSCVAVAMLDSEIVALGRAGYLASSSRFLQHRLFADWVEENRDRFRECLQPGERLVGEWLAQAHGTRYRLPHEPFVAFDLMVGHDRLTYDEFQKRVGDRFTTPRVIHQGGPLSIEAAVSRLEPSGHGALDPVERAVWRVERRGKVDFLAKYVKPDKVDGLYLPEITGKEPIWNWLPEGMGAA